VGVTEGVDSAVWVPEPVPVAVAVGDVLRLLVVDPVVESDPVADELAPSVNDAVGERDIEREREDVDEGVTEDVCVPVDVWLDVGVPLSDSVSVELGVPESLDVTEALAPSVIDAVEVSEREGLSDSVDDGVDDGVGVGEEVALPVGVDDGVPLTVALLDMLELAVKDGVSEELGVPLADAPLDSVVVGVTVDDDETLCVEDRLSLPVGVTEGVDSALPVPDPVAVTVAVGDVLTLLVVDPVVESNPVDEELAPSVSDAVGVRDIERERDVVDEGVTDDVGVPVGVWLDVGVPLSEDDFVVLGVCELLGVDDALAPSVIDDVADSETELDKDKVVLGVAEDVGVPDVVWLGVVVLLTESVFVLLGVSELLEVIDALAPTVLDGVGESDGDALRVSVDDSDGERVPSKDESKEGTCVLLIEDDDTRLGVDVAVFVGVGVVDDVPVDEEVLLPDSLLVSEPVPEALGVIEADAPKVSGGVCVFDTDALSVVVDDGVDDDVCVSVDVPETVAV
jgi:hypothetical protein